MSKIEIYINDVLNNIVADKSIKKRIKGDLFQQLSESSNEGNVDDVLAKMGNPEEVAKEFMDTIYEDKSEMIEKLIQERTKVNRLMKDYYEYKSKIKIFGLPLVHVKINKNGWKPYVAKGIIAIGNVSIGILSIGGMSFGIISIGAIAAGALSFGAVAIGLLATGAVAVGVLAVGAVAVGLGAIGACAIGKIAVGEYARGTVAIGTTTVGKFCMHTYHVGPENKAAVCHLIKAAYPNLPNWIVNIFSSIHN